MTRTPDVHFISEARTEGTKFVVLAPDFNQVAKYADEWIPIQAGQDTALWMSVNHVILKEFYLDRQVPYFVDYIKRYTDLPFLVELVPDGKAYRMGRLLRAKHLARYKGVENGDWKMLVLDAKSGEPRMPKGQVGDRWGSTNGKWNLSPEDSLDNSPIDPVLSFIDQSDAVRAGGVRRFRRRQDALRAACRCGVSPPTDGEVVVTTGFDLLMAQFGHSRGLDGAYPASYDDAERSLHAGVAGASYRHRPRDGDQVRARVCPQRGAHFRQVHGHRGCQRQPLVLQQSLLPLGHRRADPVRLLRSQRRRH